MELKNITISPVNVAERKSLDLRAGDTVKVWQKIKEGDKVRLQAFEGLVLARKHGTEPGATFTVRKVASGVGVEKIYPLYSPNVDKIEILRRAKVRRAKLYHIREKAAKEISREMRRVIKLKPQELALESAAAEQTPEMASVETTA
jgi:large subunit ribosomal protein L19